MRSRESWRRVASRLLLGLRANQRLGTTREGRGYFGVWVGLLFIGLYQQSNLILLIAGLAAGPAVASVLASGIMLRRLQVTRRAPEYVFAGDPLVIDYSLDNEHRWSAALALEIEDGLSPADRPAAATARVAPRLIFERVAGGTRAWLRWRGMAPERGRYDFTTIDLVTRAPFGLLERRMTVSATDELVVYPRVGQLTRRWNLLQREASETKRGRRHNRTAQQQEYHGLRDYRPGDSPRWIHWRTSARLAQPMVKEFEQQNEQDLAVLVDPWLPASKDTSKERDALEASLRFAATVCLEACRQPGRRLVLGWTGSRPGVRQGPASVRLLHELLTQLAVMEANSTGPLASLFDALPPSVLREAMLVIVSTRPLNLVDEANRSVRLAGAWGRNLAARTLFLNAAHGDLQSLIEFEVRSASHGQGRNGEPPVTSSAPPPTDGRVASATASGEAMQ
jgi:uncharacterized protein (DUF58 family)